jgi:DNA-binding transcriptional MerR regulator
MTQKRKLIKIGELSKIANILPSKIRFYVQERLLEVADRTNGGYYLFDEQSAMIRLRLIEKMKEEQRLRLYEIREKLNSKYSENDIQGNVISDTTR